MVVIKLCVAVGLLGMTATLASADAIRASFFNWDSQQTDKQWRERCQVLKRDGYNSIVLMGHHFRFDHVDRWPELIAALARLVRVAHAEGLRIYEHHSAVIVSQPRIEQPLPGGGTVRDLLEISVETGQPYYFKDYNGYWICPNNPRFRELYFGFLRDLFAEAPFDGLMCDDLEMLPGPIVCSCQYCRERFLGLSGNELPAFEDKGFWYNYNNPLWRQWMRARQTSVGDFYLLVKAELAKLCPDGPLFACQADPMGTLLPTAWALSVEAIDPAMDVRFWEDWAGDKPDYSKTWRWASMNLLYLGNLHGIRKPVLHLAYTPQEDQTALCWAYDRVMGAWTSTVESSPRGTYMGQFHDDPPGPGVANVAVIYSANSRDLHAERNHVGPAQLWAQAMLGAHADLGFLDDVQMADARTVSRYRLIVAPEVFCLSDRALANLRRAVSQGTHLALTEATGSYDETGAERHVSARQQLGAPSERLRVLTTDPPTDQQARELLRWAGARPMVHLSGAGSALWRLYEAGPGRYQLRVMQPHGRSNSPWRLRLRGAKLVAARLSRPDGEPLDLVPSGGLVDVPAGALTWYGQLDLECD